MFIRPFTAVHALLSRSDERAATEALGSDHPLARGIALQRSLLTQLLTTLVPVLLALVGLFLHVQRAGAVLGAAGLVGLVLCGALLLASQVTRERARKLIAEGNERLGLRPVHQERRRLASQRVRERLARALERHLDDAENWYEILPRERPPHGIRALRHAAGEAREVVARLRSDTARVPGVAAVARLLAYEEDSLFAGEVARLRAELIRICGLLGEMPRYEGAAS